MDFRVMVLLVLMGSVTSQKLFFKPHTEIKDTEEKGTFNSTVVPCPGGKSACPDQNTCCMLFSRAYGCCSLPMASCCQDGRHCCPKGTKCDVVLKACISGDMVVPWNENQPIIQDLETKTVETNLGSVLCPDGAHECETGQSCCPSSNGFACCQFPDAVCCSDQVHCCPKDTKCDLAHSRCVRQNGGDLFLTWIERSSSLKMKPMMEKVPATLGAVQCDATHQCPTGNTCCKLGSGEWGCCPQANAVCCEDHKHCCPHGTTCDTGSSKCKEGDRQMEWSEKTPAIKTGSVKCDATYECMSGATCCKTANGEWGCCPLPEAVCCSDHIHCCPSGYTCNVGSGQCSKGNHQIDWIQKEAVMKVENEKCDSTHYCPSGNTCCKLTTGQWGCCPIPNAVCCSDGEHCCPSGYTCQVGSGQCTQGNHQIDWIQKEAVMKVENVQCDSTHYCPSGNTCCKLTTGQWGCCPIPNAVCCSDGEHCCPSGYTCQVGSGQCIKGNHQIDWIQKEAVMKVENVQCDSTHYCPSGNTCCKLTTGQWGCCPIPNAVCCSDGEHCCPSGYTCQVGSGQCIKGNHQIDWIQKEAVMKVENVQCDSTHYCPSGNTCCKLTTGQWGCCPIPSAVCCSDGEHCCPSGYTCQVGSGQCTQGNHQIDWIQKEAVMKVENVQCDSTHYCPSGNTCCKLTTGQWGCCPIPNAVCCSDGEHCCPSGYTCEVGSGQCTQGNHQIDWIQKEAVMKVENVQCDSTHYCPSGNTCCKLTTGQWGCCPIPNAVCCSDGEHCCPSGYTCEVGSGQCTKGNHQIDWIQKEAVMKVENVQCDSTHYCPSGNTCCKLTTGQWGCCPIPNAVCCSDGEHCCPSGYTCQVGSGQCIKGNHQIDWIQKEAVMKVENVQCDSTHYCPSGNTCCKLTTGQWGCCPIPSAVCCSDGEHCCPSGYTCQVGSGQCTQGNHQIDWIQKEAVMKVENVQCDSTHYCPSGNTCCKLTTGQWGCCPIPNAVCCSDGEHCCPSGYTCEVGSGQCTQGNHQIDWIQKEAVMKVENVQCDSTHYCPSGNTCCKLTTGQWGCCPIPNAVCCSDGEHCCPSGYTCEVGSGQCTKGNHQIDWIQKEAVMKVENVQCDSTHYCPSGNTCCKLTTGQWGCCPIPNAVCCSDGEHCCPSGYTCQVGSGQCIKGNHQIDWIQKEAVMKVENVQCDSTHYCPSGNTCCKLTTGQWGCCPIPNAVCCSDGEHCCPSGYTCQVGSGQCIKGNHQIDWIQKEPVMKVENVQCDSTHYCPSGNTCCKLTTGQWGCCPIPNAVCCSDGEHCCPSGYTCQVGSGQCTQGNHQIDWIQKEAVMKVENEKCDSTHYCPSGNTCCKLTTGQWGCCPIPNAVCCADGSHCCPSGTTCDVTSGKCDRGNALTAWFEKVPAIKTGDVKCDAQQECPSGNTCCKLSTGAWGCCPLPNAVCCNDHTHCCPKDTKCDVATGQCQQGPVQTDWLIMGDSMETEVKVKVSDVICPDGSECQDGQTCCKMSRSEMGTYGCCPSPNAVCCSDGEHCCPKGYKCDLGHGTCNKGYIKTSWFKTLTSVHKDMQGPLQGGGQTDGQSDEQTATALVDSLSAVNKEIKEGNVPCAGTSEGCLEGNTCCSDNIVNQKCCPYHEAVCCPDKKTCCPNGYICDEESEICRIPESDGSAAVFLKELYAKKGTPPQ